MSLFDELGDLLHRARNGNAPETDVQDAYDRVAMAVPRGSIADGLSHAFRSDDTPPFEQMLSNLFHRSGPNEKAGILNQLLGVLGASTFSQALRTVIGGGAQRVAPASGVFTPQVAAQIPPEAVQVLAQQAAEKDPSIIDHAARFYSEHPALVKAIGIGALALLMSRVSSRR